MRRNGSSGNALERRAVKKPRRLGVTPQMLVWMGKNILDPFENEHGGHGHGGHGHRLVLYANGVGASRWWPEEWTLGLQKMES